jgi:hypothetical protein
MKHRILATLAGGLALCTTLAFAQYHPGTPDGVLNQTWQLQAHPQLEFAASSTEADKKAAIADKHRKVGSDSGKEDCNLQCPTE